MEHTSVKKARFPEFRDKFMELQGSMTDVEFGKKLGISRQTVGFYRNGDRIPDALGLRDIAKKCGVSADYLLGLSDCPAVDDKVKSACEFTGLSERAICILASECEDGGYYTNAVEEIINSEVLFELAKNLWIIKEMLPNFEKLFSSFDGLSDEDIRTDLLSAERRLFGIYKDFLKDTKFVYSFESAAYSVTECVHDYFDCKYNYSALRARERHISRIYHNLRTFSYSEEQK